MPLTDTLAEFPSEGYVYTTSWKLLTADMDQYERISVDGVARYLQEVGAEHLVDGDAMDDHPYWIVRRTVIDVIRPIEWPDTITLSRWCSGLSSRWCNMRVRLTGAKGGLVETEGFWIHMNMETKMPSLLQDFFVDLMSTTTTERRLRWKPWLREPLAAESDRTFGLRRSDTDRLDHVNNAVYLQAMREVYEEIPDIVSGPYRLVVEYNKPIVYGEDVRITSAPITDPALGDGLLVWLSVNGEARTHGSITRLPAPE